MGFFDKLSEKTSSAMQSAKDKTSKLSAEMKVKSQISDKKDRLGILYSEVGKEAFSNYLKGFNEITDSMKEKLQEAAVVNEDINRLNKELLEIKGIKICPACGAQIPAGSEFCPKCGKKVNEVAQAAPVETVNEEPKQEENQENNQ